MLHIRTENLELYFTGDSGPDNLFIKPPQCNSVAIGAWPTCRSSIVETANLSQRLQLKCNSHVNTTALVPLGMLP